MCALWLNVPTYKSVIYTYIYLSSYIIIQCVFIRIVYIYACMYTYKYKIQYKYKDV